jgi:hypothetical protein
MAYAPLYVASEAALRAELRLTGLKASSPGEAILLRSASAARLFIYRALGTQLALELAAEVEVDNPTTLPEIKRKAATLLEIEFTRNQLLQQMPVRVADASGSDQEDYNREGVWRQSAQNERRQILEQSTAYMQELIDIILGTRELGDQSEIQVFDGTPDCTKSPAGSAFPWVGPFTGNFTIDMGGGID